MLDQCFTAENFRKIVDLQNRRGIYLEARFFPQVDAVTRQIKTCMGDIRDLKKSRATPLPQDFQRQLEDLNKRMQGLRETKEKLLMKELQEISDEISGGSFQIRIRQLPGPANKMNYVVDEKPSAYFAIKQLQQNVESVYQAKQSNRFEIISQLREVLADKFPKYVIRTDITKFYESIPRDVLLKQIDEDALLVVPARRLLKQILNGYRNSSGNQVGIPRGIGISAYLAELYMRAFDTAIKAHGELIYYARYVDDMVIVFAPRPKLSAGRFLPFVRKQAAQLGLALNSGKTDKFRCPPPPSAKAQKYELEYLGYKLTFGDGPTEITLGNKRKRKYRDRINRSFDAYTRRSQYDEKRARRLLVRRIRFLTGNTRLVNNKKNVMIGVYYSNSLLSSLEDLKFLDGCLNSRIGSLAVQRLKDRLTKYSFVSGFLKKSYRRFNARELSEIVRPWKYET